MADVAFRFVEYETMAALKTAVEKLDNREFKTATVHCISDVSDEAEEKRRKSLQV
jgi:transcription initiation factor TFIID subunit 15